MSPSKHLALFDMDRTLVNTHTAKLYLQFQRDRGEVGALMTVRASYWLFQYTLGFVNAEHIARLLLKDYRGKSERWLSDRCQGWFSAYVQPMVSATGRARVEEHQRKGHEVAIATSAARAMVQPLADHLGIKHLVCSELAAEQGVLTGEFRQPLCYARGKLARAAAFAASVGKPLQDATFYTDSITDLSLLDAVKCPVAVNPDARLRRLASKRGWPIENWMHSAPPSGPSQP